MADVNNPAYLIPTVKIAGHTVRGRTLTIGKEGTPMSPDQSVYLLDFDPEEGAGGSVDIPTKFQINGRDIVWVGTVPQETYNNKTYKVYRGFNLLTVYMATFGTAPSDNEAFLLTIPDGYALIGTDSLGDDNHKSGLFIPNLAATMKIRVVTAGVIVGLGGSAKKEASAALVLEKGIGRPSIRNLSSVKVDVINYGVVASGGSAGARVQSGSGGWAAWGYMGGSGAPYGPYTQESVGAGQGNSPATFTAGGRGQGYGSNYAGNGGGWGERGGNARICCGNLVYWPEQGPALNGDVVVKNYNGGWQKGSEGHFTSEIGTTPPPEVIPPPEDMNDATLLRGQVNFTNMLKGSVES